MGAIVGRHLNHHHIEELLGAYALDALDAGERQLVDEHVGDCRSCWAEVRDHYEVAARLAGVAEVPPDRVWAQITASLDEVSPPATMPPPPAIVSLPHRRRTFSLGFVATGAAVAASIIAVLGIKVVDDGGRRNSPVPGGHIQELAGAATAAAGDPTAVPVALNSSDGLYFAEGVVLPDGSGYVVRHNLPPLPADRSYQLWALVGTAKISLGVLGPAPSQAAFRVAAPAWALAITEEAAGGVSVTQNEPVVVGRLKQA